MSLKIKIISKLSNRELEKKIDTEIKSSQVRASLKKAFTGAEFLPFELTQVEADDDHNLVRLQFDSDSSTTDQLEAISAAQLADIAKLAAELKKTASDVDFYYDSMNEEGYCLAFIYEIEA